MGDGRVGSTPTGEELEVARRPDVGPTRADRVLGADLAFLLLVGGLALIGARQNAPAYLDVVLVMAVVGFLSTVVLSRLIERGRR